MSNNAIIFQNKHVSYMENLLKPLSLIYPIKKIIYVDLLMNENKACFLSNQVELAEKFFIIGRFSDNVYKSIAKAKLNQNYFYVWPSIQTDPTGLMLHNMNLRNGISVFKKTKTSIQRWSFIGNNDQGELTSMFLNDQATLLKFINYFQHHLNHQSKLDKVYATFETINDILKNPVINKENQTLFNNTINVNRYFFGDSLKEAYITRKELECFWHFSQNQRYKKISKALNISEKAARKRIDSVKLRLGIEDPYQILELIKQYNLFYWL